MRTAHSDMDEKKRLSPLYVDVDNAASMWQGLLRQPSPPRPLSQHRAAATSGSPSSSSLKRSSPVGRSAYGGVKFASPLPGPPSMSPGSNKTPMDDRAHAAGGYPESGGVRIADLCDSDKEKIAKLIQQLITVGKANKEYEKRLDDQEHSFSERLNKLQVRNEEIVKENLEVQNKFSSSLKLLRTYQEKLTQWQEKHDQLLEQTKNDEAVAKQLQEEVARLHDLIIQQKKAAPAKEAPPSAVKEHAERVEIADASTAAESLLSRRLRNPPRVIKFPTPRSLARMQEFLGVDASQQIDSNDNDPLRIEWIGQEEAALSHYDAHLLEGIMQRRHHGGKRRKKKKRGHLSAARRRDVASHRSSRRKTKTLLRDDDDGNAVSHYRERFSRDDDDDDNDYDYEHDASSLQPPMERWGSTTEGSISSVSRVSGLFEASLIDIVDELESLGGV